MKNPCQCEIACVKRIIDHVMSTPGAYSVKFCDQGGALDPNDKVALSVKKKCLSRMLRSAESRMMTNVAQAKIFTN